MTWQGENFGYAIKAVAGVVEPDRPALIHGDRIVTWAEFDTITDSIAAGLLDAGLKPGAVAGQMLRNGPEYMLAYFGCAKAGITPINVNYHYKDRELRDIFARFEIEALFVNEEFADTACSAMPDGALEPFVVERSESGWVALCSTQVPDDFTVCRDTSRMFYLATGGTTGLPKTVMWPFSEAWQALGVASWTPSILVPPLIAESLEQHLEQAARIGPGDEQSTSPMMVLCPLMHGTAQYSAVNALMHGGTLVTLPGSGFDANLTIDTIRERQVRTIVIVGDAFAIPLADALEAREDAAGAIASLSTIGSSGALFSLPLKQRLLAMNPAMVIQDVLGSSESGGTAIRVTTAAGSLAGGRFVAVPDRDTKLLGEGLKEIPPGSDGIGIVARSGPLPAGYLGEDEKNAQTFPVIDGKRYLLTGDQARWGEDGSLEFIGRDNMCINTGGEKVFPEEVEEVLMDHARVHDVRVVSLPDERFGRRVVAVVQPHGDVQGLADELDAHMRAEMATYKVPRAYFFTTESLRLNNGKPDYRTAQRIADEADGSG